MSATPDPMAPGATGNVSSFSVIGAKVTVNLKGVSSAQTILVTLSEVSDGQNTNDVRLPMGVLVGDVDANRSVKTADVTLTQSKIGQTVNATNFREDVTIDGFINASDVSVVRSQKGTSLP